MTHEHISPEMIKRQIESTHSYYNLGTEEIIMLRRQGVAEAVITFMQDRRRAGVVHAPVVVPSPPPVVVYERPYYPPPPPVVVGGCYHWHR
jgi:hypothetical protein